MAFLPPKADSFGNSKTVLCKSDTGDPIDTSVPAQVYSSNPPLSISANGTVNVKSGGGTLIAININTKGASANVLTAYDNTAASGTKIINSLDTVNQIGRIQFDAAFTNGLTIVLATGTAADLTITYR